MASFEVVTYNDVLGRLEIPRDGDTYSITQPIAFTAAMTATTINGRNITVDGTKLDLLTVTSALDLDALAASVATLSDITLSGPVDLGALETKLDLITVTAATDLDEIRDQVNGVTAAVVLKGMWDASTSAFPTSTKAGESWIVSTAGTVDGIEFSVNDRVLALVDNANGIVYANNWLKLDYTDAVLSVNGFTGAVDLTAADLSGDPAVVDTDPRLTDARAPTAHTHGPEELTSFPVTLNYTFKSRDAASGENYIGGFYEYSDVDANLANGSNTVTVGTVNSAHGGHAFMVFGAGSTDGSNITITVTGASIAEDGTRTASDSEVLYTGPVGGLTVNDYLETTKRWIGLVTYTLTSDGGTFTCDFNYGLADYEKIEKATSVLVTGFDIRGLADGNDAGFDIQLISHDYTTWTYAATGFVAGGTVMASLITDCSPDSQLVAGEHFVYRRRELGWGITSGRGLVIKAVTTAANSVAFLNANIYADVTY